MGWLDRLSKPIRSRIGDVWDRGFETGRGGANAVGSIGSAVADLAEAPFTDDEYDGFLGTIYDIATKRGAAALGDLVGPKKGLGAAIGGLPEGVRAPVSAVGDPTLRFSERAYNDVISHPISAAMTAASKASEGGPAITLDHGVPFLGGISLPFDVRLRTGDPGKFFSGDTWRDAWKESEDRSPGQAIALGIGTQNIDDPREVERFAATDNYRMWSGVADAMLRYRFDPTIVAGEAIKGARGLMVARDVETGAVRLIPKSGLATQEQVIAARDSTRVARFVDRVETIVDKDPAAAAGRIRTELFPDHAEGAYISDLLATAPDTVARRRIVGSLMGSAEDFAALTEDAPTISHKIRQLTSDTLDALEQERGMRGRLGPGRVEMLDNELRALYPQQDQIAKVAATFGTVSEVPGASMIAQARAGITTSAIYQESALTAPLRVVTNMLPQHWLNLNDARGDVQVSRMLQQSGLAPERQLELRGRYMAETTAAARQRAAIDIEGEIVQGVLDKYDVPKWIVDDVLKKAPRLREEATGALSRRMYDAEGRGSVLVEQADGVPTRVHLPLHVTQQADLLPLVDVGELERAARAVKGWDWDSGVFDSMKNAYEEARLAPSGSKGAQAVALAMDAPAELLDVFYSLWRPATLLRVGWPARILADEQLRILSKLGAMSHVGTLAEATVDNVRQRLTPWEVTVADGEKLAGRGLPKLADAMPEQVAEGLVRRGIGDYENVIKARSGETYRLAPAFGPPGDAANVFKRLNSSSGAFRELAVQGEDELLRTMRQHTGSWTSFDPKHGDYPAIWASTVNRQIKQSAFARQALQGKTIEEMVDWLAGKGEQVADAAPTGSIGVGSYVKAADRSNIGRVVSINDDGSAAVRFVNKTEGTEATVSLRLDQLSLRESAKKAAAEMTGPEYAREMGWRPKNFEAHAADVLDQVQRYVPTDDLRRTLLERDLSHADLAKAVPDEIARPAVHGEDIAQALGQSGLGKLVRNVRDGMFKWLGQLPTDVLSRNPYFDAMYRMEGERLINLADDAAKTAGRALEQGDLDRIAGQARRFALNESQSLLYDLAEKSHFAHMLRFAAPFYMAWQEVLTRWAGIAVDNPTYVARLRQVWDAPEKAGLVSDENGYTIDAEGHATDPLTGKRVPKGRVGADRYITLPFGIPGLPTHGPVRFNKKSANLALSGTPGFGPPVQIAVNELVKDKPDLERSVKFVLPFGASQSTLALVLPSSAKKAYSLSQGKDDRLYLNTLNRIMGDRMTDFQLGKRKDKPTYREVKKATDQLYMLRSVASWVSPVSPIFDSPYQPFINAYRNAQERLRDNPNAFGVHDDGTPITADEWFLDSYGEDYFYLTQSLTKSNDGVAPTAEGYDARERYKDLIEKHGDLGSLIIGNEGAGNYSSGVYQSQLAHDTHPGSGTKQRTPYSFDEYTQQPEVRLGWMKYSQAMDTIEAERVRQGLPNLQVKAAQSLALIKQAFTQRIAEKYPAWFDEFSQQDTSKWAKRITALMEIAHDPRLANRPDRPDIAGLKAYLDLRSAFTVELARREHHAMTALANSDLANAWHTLSAAIVEKYVAFAPIFYRYLERDPLTVETP